MAEIVAMSAYRSVHDRIQQKRSAQNATVRGGATLLLFTGIRREPLAASSQRQSRRDGTMRRTEGKPASDV